jgi:hypothetical protein
MSRTDIPVVERYDDPERVKASLYGSIDPAGRYRVERDITADGRALKAGETVRGAELERGTLESCVRTGALAPAGD